MNCVPLHRTLPVGIASMVAFGDDRPDTVNCLAPWLITNGEHQGSRTLSVFTRANRTEGSSDVDQSFGAKPPDVCSHAKATACVVSPSAVEGISFELAADIPPSASRKDLFVLPEHSSPKAARILEAAGQLLLAHGAKGVTIAGVAQKAYVGKGTVYLYWGSKEELLVGLIGREFLAVAETLTLELSRDPESARPSRFCRLAVDTMSTRPLVSALEAHNESVLGLLTDHPLSTSIYDALGPLAMLRAVLPIWRSSGLARTDWDEADQILALHTIVTGFVASSIEPPPIATSTDPMVVFERTVTALLGAEKADLDQLRSAADAIKTFFADGSATVLDLISMTAAGSSATTHQPD
ncbi:TetR/AcrR family transcriptional regulator [Mycolicibacterium nivoides]|uniref:TetR/AcrR family transcriptional regulator n=1 Tax=Mycolicibacterium nivoides TaxID=2487344 RepID=UPI003C2DA9F7